MALPTLVADLVHAVGRAFYRDEFVFVLDALTRSPVRDDGLYEHFGLHERQVRKILKELQRESLVSEEIVVQRLKHLRKRAELDGAQAEAARRRHYCRF